MASNKYQELFKARLEEEGFAYCELEDLAVCIGCKGEALPTISLCFCFHPAKEGALVEIRSWNIAHVPKEKRIAALRLCNEMNRKYRLYSFYVSEEDEIIVELDHFISEEACGEFCISMMKETQYLVDQVYPYFAKALLGKRR